MGKRFGGEGKREKKRDCVTFHLLDGPGGLGEDGVALSSVEGGCVDVDVDVCVCVYGCMYVYICHPSAS